MPPTPITIVGAGLAGLTLARCLKQHGIAAIVLEKASSSSRHNYGITIQPWAFRPLLKVLQMDEGLFREQLAVDSVRKGSGEVIEDTVVQAVKAEEGTFRCHRGRLERLLQEGQDIKWEHAVQTVTTSSQGISVELKDAKPLEIEVLIGTDGVHSQVRKSLAPDIELKVLPFVVFNGRRQFSHADFRDLVEPKLGSQAIVQERHDGLILEISINDYTPEHVDVSYTYSRPARDNDPLHRPDRAMAGATDIPEEFYNELKELTDLQEPFKGLFQAAKVRKDRVFHWLMRSNLGDPAEVDQLVERGILLIGDAIHAMPVLGGEGANHAMKDGIDLARHIVHHGTGRLQDFTEARYGMWRQGVEDSEKRLAEIHGQTKAYL